MFDAIHVELFKGTAGHSRPAVVFLHGFPAYSARNEDLAALVAAECGLDVFVPNYRGLGKSSGEFTFTGAAEDSKSLVGSLLQDGYPEVYLVAHSFGATVAFKTAASEQRVSKIFLMAPLLFLPDEKDANSLVDYFVSEEAKLGHEYVASDLKLDQSNFRKDFDSIQIATRFIRQGTKITIAHGDQDKVISISSSTQWISMLPNQVALETMHTDHWFTGFRTELAASISKFFGGPAK